jgi:hypothetical protein
MLVYVIPFDISGDGLAIESLTSIMFPKSQPVTAGQNDCDQEEK